MQILVVGLGHVGKPIYELFRGKDYDVAGIDIDVSKGNVTPPVDFLHICFGYNDSFEKETLRYMQEYSPKITVIESTVPVGTTRKIYEKTRKPVFNSPIKGNEKDGMMWGLLKYTKFIGSPDKSLQPEAEKLLENFKSAGVKAELAGDSNSTELAKLLETSYYALMIAFFQEIERMCIDLKADFNVVSKFQALTTQESGHKHLRPVFYPGVIGGHCLIPNAELLESQYDSPFLKAILESNDKKIESSQTKPEAKTN
jgi:UDP-N-acetyl-D-mannosaminuronate dehydrogenase